jgi:SnoaL-like polyketide cyclase
MNSCFHQVLSTPRPRLDCRAILVSVDGIGCPAKNCRLTPRVILASTLGRVPSTRSTTLLTSITTSGKCLRSSWTRSPSCAARNGRKENCHGEHHRIAKALIIAYNEKNWIKVKDMLAADAVYDEKATHRQIQGVGEIIYAWQDWAKTIPNSKATFVREHSSGDTAIFEIVWKGIHAGPLQTSTGSIPALRGSIEFPACEIMPGRRREGQEHFALLRHAHAAHTDRRHKVLVAAE